MSNFNKTINEFDKGITKVTTSKHVEKGISKVNISFIGGFGLDYDLLEKFQIRFEPIFRHSIISITDNDLKDYLWSAGLNVGLYYKL